jgi:hypothetical protein
MFVREGGLLVPMRRRLLGFTGEAAITDTYTDTDVNAEPTTISGLNIGAEDTNRTVLVMLACGLKGAGNVSITDIGGVTPATTWRVLSLGTTEDTQCAAALAVVPTGTTASVTLEATGGGQRFRGLAMNIARLIGYGTIYDDIGSINNDTSPSDTLNSTSNSFIMEAMVTDSAASGIAFDEATEDADIVGTIGRCAVGHIPLGSVGSPTQAVGAVATGATAGDCAWLALDFDPV